MKDSGIRERERQTKEGNRDGQINEETDRYIDRLLNIKDRWTAKLYMDRQTNTDKTDKYIDPD